LADQGIAFREDYVLISNLSQESGVDAANQIRNMNPLPDAVLCSERQLRGRMYGRPSNKWVSGSRKI